MRKLNEVLTKRVLKWLDEEAKGDPEKYALFFAQHGHCLKEGVATDYTHRESLAKLLRFVSSHTEGNKTTSLPDYVSRMPEAQKEIYYLLASSREAAEASPYYEVFRARGYEVLFLMEPRDEFVMDHLANFDGKRVVSAEKADLQLEDEKPHALSEDEARQLANFIKETLGDRVEEVRVSKRLTGSPAVVVDKDTHMTTSMRRVMKALQQREGGTGPDAFETKPDLEINPDHPAIVALEKKRHADAALAAQVAEQVFDSALVAAGLLEDPRAMLSRINALLERVLA
jgi:molecular chaperone HtpG